MIIAIQGVDGSFHHQAAQHYFSTDITAHPHETFRGVFDAIAHSKANYGIVAVENSLYGSITSVLDLLEEYQSQLVVIGEIYLHIRQQLIGLPNADLLAIRAVYSHPVALAQCEAFLDTYLPHAQRIEHHDTAAAVDFVKEQDDPTKAAIAGTAAAERYALPILASDIEDNKENYTRFLVIARRPGGSEQANKASLVITTDHAPGALSSVLGIFTENGANLTKLQSRPIIGSPWQYKFYIDIEASPELLEHCITAVRTTGTSVIELGRYTAGKL